MSAASDSLKAKIAALRAKTTAAGCTEAEAMAAAEVAARMMRQHGLSEADLVMTEATSPEASSRTNWRWSLASAIAVITNTAAIYQWSGAFLFIGRAPGPEIAAYLRDLCIRAVDGERGRFKDTEFYRRRRKVATRRAALADFTEAMVIRLVNRLHTIFGDAMDEALLKGAERALSARFPQARVSRRGERDTRFHEAALLGHVAGGRTRLDRGVAGGTDAPAGLIGGRS